MIGAVIDNNFSDHSLTMGYKVIGGLATAGLILFLARQMKKIVLRTPIRKDQMTSM